MSPCVCERVCTRARARVSEIGGEGGKRFNIFPVTYEPVGELLAARLGPCVHRCGCVFLVCPTCECHGTGGLATSLCAVGLGGTESCGVCVDLCPCEIIYRRLWDCVGGTAPMWGCVCPRGCASV